MQKKEMAFGRIPAYCKYELFMERYRSAAEIVKKTIAVTPETTILDVGCGNGNMKYFFDDHEAKWFGIECWQARIEKCRSLGYTVVDLDLNSTPLPYPAGYFDVIFASHVIEHLSNIAFSLQEMDRVLKKGGLLLIATPTKPPVIAAMIHYYHTTQEKRRGQTQNAFSAGSLRRFIKKQLPGYTLLDCRGFRIFSARKQIKIENSYIFYKISTFISRYLTWIVPEVNCIYMKNK